MNQTFYSIIWTFINTIYNLVDGIFNTFIKMNSIDIIKAFFDGNNVMKNAYHSVIVISVLLVAFFAIWNFIKKFIDPDETPPVETITREVIICTVGVAISSFVLTQLFNFSVVFTGWSQNLFKDGATSFASNIIKGYVEVGDDFKTDYKGNQISLNYQNARDLSAEYLNKYSVVTGKTYKTNSDGSCKTETKKVSRKYSKQAAAAAKKDEIQDDLDADTSTIKRYKNLKWDDTFTSEDFDDRSYSSLKKVRKNVCKSISNLLNSRSYDDSKFPEGFGDGKYSGSVEKLDQGIASTSDGYFSGNRYSETPWYKRKIYNQTYIKKAGKFGLDMLAEKDMLFGGNLFLLLFTGMFLAYAMFFSGIMLARRLIEMLLMFFMSPMVMACSICNKQRRQTLYQELASLILQAAALMLILGLSSYVISWINSTAFDTFASAGGTTDALLLKTFFLCAVATLILTGSQAVNKFIGANVAANSGRESMQAMSGFNSALKGTAIATGLGGVGVGLAGAKAGVMGLKGARGVGRLATNKDARQDFANSVKNSAKNILDNAVGRAETVGGLAMSGAGAVGAALSGAGSIANKIHSGAGDKFKSAAENVIKPMTVPLNSAGKHFEAVNARKLVYRQSGIQHSQQHPSLGNNRIDNLNSRINRAGFSVFRGIVRYAPYMLPR